MPEPRTVGQTMDDIKQHFLSWPQDRKIKAMQTALDQDKIGFFIILFDFCMEPIRKGGIPSDVLAKHFPFHNPPSNESSNSNFQD